MNKEESSRIRLLVADDSFEMAKRLVERLVELDGIEIIGPASNGREAINLFDRHKPHGAVLDLQMPQLSGLEVLAAIRKCNPFLLIVIMSIHTDGQLRDRCIESGANYFVDKSDQFENIVKIVKEFFGI